MKTRAKELPQSLTDLTGVSYCSGVQDRRLIVQIQVPKSRIGGRQALKSCLKDLKELPMWRSCFRRRVWNSDEPSPALPLLFKRAVSPMSQAKATLHGAPPADLKGWSHGLILILYR